MWFVILLHHDATFHKAMKVMLYHVKGNWQITAELRQMDSPTWGFSNFIVSSGDLSNYCVDVGTMCF